MKDQGIITAALGLWGTSEVTAASVTRPHDEILAPATGCLSLLRAAQSYDELAASLLAFLLLEDSATHAINNSKTEVRGLQPIPEVIAAA